MAETGETGGLSALTLGGAATVVVVVGGAVMVWLGVFDSKNNENAPRDGSSNTIAISPSATPPVIIQGLSQEPDPLTDSPDETDPAAQETAQVEAFEETEAEVPTPVISSSGAGSTASEANDLAVQDAEVESAAAAAADTDVADADNTLTTPLRQSTDVAGAEMQGDAGQALARPVASPVDTATEETVETQIAALPAANGPAATTSQDVTAGQSSDAPLFDAPLLDLVRVSPAGEAVIAGRATEGVNVAILLDGSVIEQVEVQSGGDFVAFAQIPPSSQARVISLRASAEGQVRFSESSFILAPVSSVPATPRVAALEAVEHSTETEQVAVDTAAVEDDHQSDLSSENAAEDTDVQVSEAQISEEQVADPAVTDQITEVQSEDAETAVSVVVSTETVTADAEIATTGTNEDETPESSGNTPGEVVEEQVAKAPRADASTIAPKAVEPAAVIASPETSQAAQTSNAVSQPTGTTLGNSEGEAEAQTSSAPQPEATQVAVLRADAEGVTLVQPVAQKPQGKVVLDTISYSDTGEVQLAGRAGAAANVLVYLDNSPAGQFLAASNGSWGGRLEAVDPGVYTLRLDEVNSEGKVLSRLETPFKREAPEVLLPPVSESEATGDTVPLVRAVTVQEGDTLWAISQQRYGSGFLYVRVFEANQNAIRDPDLIYPGQVFAIPD